jgi:hypothetical protein
MSERARLCNHKGYDRAMTRGIIQPALVIAIGVAAAGCDDGAALSTLPATLAQSNGTLGSVEGAFAVATTSGNRFGVRPGGSSLSALTTSSRHVQGVARLAQGAYLALSGSNSSDLFIVDLASRSDAPTVRWGSNRPGGAAPPSGDAVIAQLDVGAAAGYPGLDHAGGIQAIGDYVVVGLEPLGATSSTPSSAVAIVRADVPTAPWVTSVIDRTGRGTAGATGITRLADGRWLLAVGEFDSARIDLYVSTGADLGTAIWTLVDEWSRGDVGGLCAAAGQSVSGAGYGAYQNLNLITQANGQLYLVGTHRDSSGADFADLYRVEFFGSLPPCGFGNTTSGWKLRLTKVAKKHVTCTDYCDFDGGGGVYINSTAGELYLYGAERLYSGTRGYLRLNEF